jgi:DNA-binding transcriptional MerR regulator
MQKLFRIGQISNLYGISLDTLRHYDRKGLLKPVVDEESGYRYYSFEHLDVLEMILVGKYLEIPLEQMKEKIEAESIDGYLNMMEEQSRFIEERLKVLKKLNQYTRGMADLLKVIRDFSNDDTFSHVTIEEHVDINIYHVDLDYFLTNRGDSQTKGIEAFEQWFGYQADGEGIITESSQTVGVSIHGQMLKDKELKQFLKLAPKDRICGRCRHISFWGNEEELKDYLHRICCHFNLKDTLLHVKFRFALLHRDRPNEYFTEIYFS